MSKDKIAAIAALAIVAAVAVAAATPIWSSMGEAAADWTPFDGYYGDLDPRTYHRAETEISRVVVQRGGLRPRYAVELGVDTGIETTCSNNRIAAVYPGDGDLSDSSDEDLAWQIMDSARYAMARGSAVAVVVDRGDTVRTESGCARPTVVRLAIRE